MESKEPEEEKVLYDRIKDRYPEHELRNIPSILTLDFSPPEYQLLNIAELESDQEYRQFFIHLQILNVSRNKLKSIKLKNFKFLEKVDAVENILSVVELNLPKLSKLDLSKNFLTEIPDLTNVPNLSDLRLNKNCITKISYDQLKPVKATLITLELNYNKIDFPKLKEFFEFAEQLGKNMRKLRSISIDKNPFTQSVVYSKDYKNVFLYYCEHLDAFNGKTLEDAEKQQSKQIGAIKTKIINNEAKYGYKTKDYQKMLESGDVGKNNKKRKLSQIKQAMEKYQTVSRMNQSNFSMLKTIMEEYLNSCREEELNNANAIISDADQEMENEAELEEFEKFLESCNVIIENNSTLELPLFNIVANFAIIKNGMFSELALTFFRHHLNSQEKAEIIRDVINDTIIEYINYHSESQENIPSSIITGLQEFASEPKFKQVTKSLSEKLKNIVIKCNDIKIIGVKTNKEDLKKKEIFSASMNYLSELCSEDEDILFMLLKEREFMKSIAHHLKQLLSQGEDTLVADKHAMRVTKNILNIVRALCIYPKDEKNTADNQIADENISAELCTLKDSVEKLLADKLAIFVKSLSDSSVDNQSKESRFSRRMYLGSLIKCFGSLCAVTDTRKISLSPSSVISQLLTILSHSNFYDPVIMAAICNCIVYIFMNPAILENANNEFTTISNKLYSLKTPLMFLFPGLKYNTACDVAQQMGQNTLLNGNAVELENLSSEIMHQMFISIINLITFFGKKASEKIENTMGEICQKVCYDLNESGRDRILTNCLKIPSDEVKKSVVNCLFYVDSTQFEKEELYAIYSQISGANLMAGDIEEVVSTIYIILAKSFRNFMEDPKGVAKEKIEYNKDAFSLAFNILVKNQERLTSDDSESEQKEMLSIALVVFLINCSCFESIKKFYSDKLNGEKVPVIFYNEETKLNQRFALPIEAEKCRSGWNILYLYNCMKGGMMLYPYTYVFLRIMIHIADMMLNIAYPAYPIRQQDEFSTIIENFREEIKKREYERIQNEKKTFKEFIEEQKRLKRFNAEESLDLISLAYTELKEEQNKFVDIFPSLLLFIYGKNSNSKSAEFEKVWEDKQDPKINLLSFSVLDTHKGDDGDMIGNLNAVGNDGMINDNENIFQRFSRFLREEPIKNMKSSHELALGHQYIRLDKPKPYAYGEGIDVLQRRKEEETANNPYLRGLVIAAFLRAIYAVLEYPAEREIKEKMISTLKKGNTIKEISILVDSTKLKDFNISSKYLMIMRLVLFNSSSKKRQGTSSNINEDNEILNQIGIISFIIKKMIKLIQDDIRLDIEDHKIFLSELSKCALVIAEETYALNFQSDELRERVMSSMINYDLVKMFIDTVIQYMHRETELIRKEFMVKSGEKTGLDVKRKRDEESLNDMIFKISYILGEYMSKCKEYSYRILESFTRSYIFSGVNMRKTYLREIIETSKMSDLKMKLEKDLSMKISLVSRCIYYNYKEQTEEVRYMLLTELGFEFLDIVMGFDALVTPEWAIEKNYEPKINETELKYKYEDILFFYALELSNRVVIKTKNTVFGLFFIKSHISNQVLETVKLKNGAVKDFKNIPIMKTDSDKKKGMEEAILGDLKKDDTGNEETNIVFMCLIKEMGKFFGFLSRLVNDREIIPSTRIVLLRGKRLIILKENLDMWKFANPNELVKKDIQSMSAQEKFLISNNIYEYYSEVTSYDLDSLTGVKFSKVDLITLQFDSGTLEMQMFDDISYIRLRKVVIPIAIQKGYYTNIITIEKNGFTQNNIYDRIK